MTQEMLDNIKAKADTLTPERIGKILDFCKTPNRRVYPNKECITVCQEISKGRKTETYTSRYTIILKTKIL